MDRKIAMRQVVDEHEDGRMEGGPTVRQVKEEHDHGRMDGEIAVKQAGEEQEGRRRGCIEAGGLVEEVHEGDGRAGRQVRSGPRELWSEE